MIRRIVIYENNNMNRGEAIFGFGQHVNPRNNVMERDIASFILQLEKSQKHPVNAMLVVKYIIFHKNRANYLSEAIDYLFHRKDFKPYSAPLPEHVTLKSELRKDAKTNLDGMGF